MPKRICVELSLLVDDKRAVGGRRDFLRDLQLCSNVFQVMKGVMELESINITDFKEVSTNAETTGELDQGL